MGEVHMAAISPPVTLFCAPSTRTSARSLKRTTTSMSGEPRQRKLGSAGANGNWQLGSPTAANGEKTQTADAPSRATSGDRAPTAAADAPYNSSNLQAAVQHNVDNEKEKPVEATCGPG